MRSLIFLLLLISQGAYSQSELNEGTQTQMTGNDIKEYLPLASNSKKLLEDALSKLKLIPLNERLKFLESEIKNVVLGSANKKYQLLMRYALNRGLQLSSLIEKETITLTPGIVQNQVDILTQSIQVSFEFYESDLNFVRRASKLNGDQVLVIPFAQLGIKLAKSYLKTAKNIFDVTAQYQVMRKTFKFLRIDYHQDKNSISYANEIVDITKALEKLPEIVLSDDEALKGVRALNYLQSKFAIIETPRKERLKEMQSWFPKKNILYYIPHDRYYAYMGEQNINNAIIICERNPLFGKRWHLISYDESLLLKDILKDSIVANKFFKMIDGAGEIWTSNSLEGGSIITPWISSGPLDISFNSSTEASLYFNYKTICVADD